MAAAARSMHQPMTPDELLQAIVDVAAASIPGFDRASVSVLEGRGRESTRAATDELVRKLDALQYELGEGPCLEAMKGPWLVESAPLRHEQRWPHYVPTAVQHGIRSQLAIKLYLTDDQSVVGGLNMYSTVTDEVSEEARTMAELFAAQAAVALGSNRERHNLNEALHSRQVIGQAIGVVMARYDLDQDRAFEFLIRVSRDGNIKLRQVAQDLVDEANDKAPR